MVTEAEASFAVLALEAGGWSRITLLANTITAYPPDPNNLPVRLYIVFHPRSGRFNIMSDGNTIRSGSGIPSVDSITRSVITRGTTHRVLDGAYVPTDKHVADTCARMENAGWHDVWFRKYTAVGYYDTDSMYCQLTYCPETNHYKVFVDDKLTFNGSGIPTVENVMMELLQSRKDNDDGAMGTRDR